ncbi:MAG: hypothetical protein WD557_09150 [Dehalococcoidia bacterium]
MRIEPISAATPTGPARAPATVPPRAPLAPSRTDLIVLSAAAYRALISAPRSAADLAGTFSVNVANASGQISVAPGTMDGVVTVSIDLFHVPVWPDPPGPIRQLHLTAQLRGSWVARVATDDAPRSDQAQQVAAAVTQLAQLPGQKTVAVEAVK